LIKKRQKELQIKCVYCLYRKKSSEFNKEHVIPESFGRFKQSMTLIEIVCSDCNSYFSKNLENDLGRDSVYGVMHRCRAGVTDIAEFIQKKKHKKILSDAYIKHKEHGFLLVDLADFVQSTHPVFYVNITSQIIVMNSTKGVRVNFRIDHKLSGSFIKSIGLCPKVGYIDIFFPYQTAIAEYHKAIKILQSENISMGINKNNLAQVFLGKEPQDLHFRSIVDQKILRAISKVAFNYFIKQYGANVALSVGFDDIRNYIRHGTYVGYQMVKPIHRNIYYRDQLTGNSGVGHIIVIQQDKMRNIVALISLFNSHIYEISLCKNYPILLPEQGSFFDTKNKSIHTHSNQKLKKIFQL